MVVVVAVLALLACIAIVAALRNTRFWYIPGALAIAGAIALIIDSQRAPSHRTDTALGAVMEVIAAVLIILIAGPLLALGAWLRARRARLGSE
ncbi:MAG: hypothetical protein QM831_12195 [Kofleriaceae bacterium]